MLGPGLDTDHSSQPAGDGEAHATPGWVKALCTAHDAQQQARIRSCRAARPHCAVLAWCCSRRPGPVLLAPHCPLPSAVCHLPSALCRSLAAQASAKPTPPSSALRKFLRGALQRCSSISRFCVQPSLPAPHAAAPPAHRPRPRPAMLR
ncbi:hypothetical protein SVAN01_05143 [Stagonosporopsis vannaccii]|nr:hypothetical protein SVAN01_05143 [Stagonosporopsis vannaccii]